MAVHITRAGVALTVGIILLTGLIIGGLFMVKETGEQARRDEAITIAEETLQEQSDEEVALNDGTAEEQASNDDDAAQAPAGVDDTAQDQSGQTPASELPATGPAETASFVAIGLVAFAVTAYYRSRRALLDVL